MKTAISRQKSIEIVQNFEKSKQYLIAILADFWSFFDCFDVLSNQNSIKLDSKGGKCFNIRYLRCVLLLQSSRLM